MSPVDMPAKTIVGISTRTDNKTGVGPDGKIVILWQRFLEKIVGHSIPDTMPYGVYTDYQTDASGVFTLTAGVEVADDFMPPAGIVVQKLPAGRYLRFSARGQIPACVIACWDEIHTYFDSPTAEYERSYETDYEIYPGDGHIEIFVGIK